ncbi:hypothetical protein K470DRAFT_267254 [Piedraia hortae CBS 480.64]|uniref:DRBM domain-containing protein n=1 Tax=Piedraia hortae CBS 480.64 TaxID=1314780 RepID=A0A6A7CBX0_9PEZI|nr:hypothetical protein K470DRAFT_267254 [Piedraia hortae CBS 480.64]
MDYASPKEVMLTEFCRASGYLAPIFQIVSDRRGGRTAWSCTVQVGPHFFEARHWYDGQYVHNAREDAAERALQAFGQLPVPKPMFPQQQNAGQTQRRSDAPNWRKQE